MPYVEISEEIYDGLDDDFKAKLTIYQPEDVSGLKEKANTILGEKKSLEVDLAQARADLKAAKMSKAAESSDEDILKLQSQLDDAVHRVKDWEGKYNGLLEDNKRKTVEGEASRIAATMTKDTNRAKLLKDQILSRLTLDGGKFSVLDEAGNPTISSVEELTGQIRTQYPFLVDASQASGGGAKGGSGGATHANKKFDQYNAGELSQIKRETPEVYDRLKAEFYGE